MQIPLVDLKAQYASLAEEMAAAVTGVMQRGDFILGGAVQEFEKNFAAYIGTTHCVGVNSGTDALWLALAAAGVKAGDEVLVPANTFIATALAVTLAGARPVLVDADPGTYNLDWTRLEAALTRRTRAVIPVHLYGQPADMDRILAFAADHNLIVVEDACQAHAAMVNGRRCGSLGLLGCFSFYPGKNLGAYGDGGAVTTSDPALAEKISVLRNCGQKVKYVHPVKGGNSRLDTMQAAVLNVKLPHLDAWTRSRIHNAHLYARHLAGIRELQLPSFDKRAEFSHVFHLYVVRAVRRDALLAFLREKGVFGGIHYPIPIHLQEAYAELGHKAGAFPVSEKAANEILSLPMYAELSEDAIRYIADCIREFYARPARA
jgi:dTDP-4-amino-4,6-dideoxygalactose transaminase